MSGFVDLYGSPVAKKFVMAVSGLMLFGFVLVHMAGNAKMYLGEAAFNAYAEGLRAIGEPFLPHGSALWIARSGLIVAVLLHIWSAWQLTLLNRRARPRGYERKAVVQATYASRTMRWGGVIILVFIVYHLLHLTFGTVHSSFDPTNPYHNVVAGFQNYWVSGFYILANVLLAFHLYHGLWSLFQSLGWNHPSYRGLRRPLATAFAVVVTAGNISFPLAVLAGIVK
jgi:succinate dehydrogenase / fumarate reductase cytochrome b subunit